VKIIVNDFNGETPIVSNRSLANGYASHAINCKLTSTDCESFEDIGNPFVLSKNPIINTIWLMMGPAPTYWMQFMQSEVAYGENIDLSLGTIPGDMTYRTFITGLSGGPQVTNLFYATDPSQRGSNAIGAYPYVTYPLGIASPTGIPAVIAPVEPSGTSTTYGYAAEVFVNNGMVNNPGSGYVLNDIISTNEGTIDSGLFPAQFEVTSINDTGGITGISLTYPGNFIIGGGPPAIGATTTGGTGTGATLNLTIITNSPTANNFTGFETEDYNNGAGSYRTWTVNSAGNWMINSGQGDLTVAYSENSFGLRASQSWSFEVDEQTDNNGSGEYPDLVTYLCGTYSGANYVTGPGVVLSKTDGSFTLYNSFSGNNGAGVTGTIIAQNLVSITGAPNESGSNANMYRIKVSAIQQTSSTTPGFTVTVTLALSSNPNTIISTLTGFISYVGEVFGIGTNHRGTHTNGNAAEFKNIVVTVLQPPDAVTSESTSYVYTYGTTKGSGANAIEEESGPSDPSQTITIYLDTTKNPVTLSPVTGTIPAVPAGQYITDVFLYRLAKQDDGSEVYQYDQRLNPSTTAPIPFTDTVLDEDLGDPITTTDYVPPPSNLEGILALPNGIMAGFFGNTLCLSTQNYPFSYPVGNQLPTDDPIVAIAAIDATVLVLTTGHPYTAYGSDPSAFQMSKETANQGCVSKRSVATHKRVGVIYASGNGLCFYRGQGALDLIKGPNDEPLFSLQQWQSLNPSSIIGVVHDDKYWFWFTRLDGTQGGYMLDFSGHGLIELDYHVTAPYVDHLTDKLYFVPDSSVYPINGSVVTSPTNVVSQWEYGPGFRIKLWERDEYLLPRPSSFVLARVRAEDYTDVQFTLSCERGTAYSGPVLNEDPFTVEAIAGIRWNMQMTGSSTINTMEAVESNAELMP